MRKHFIYTLWGIFATFVVSAMLAFFAIWNGWNWLHAGHRGSAESYQQIRHSGVFVRWKGAGYMEPEQGEPYRDTLQEMSPYFNKGTGLPRRMNDSMSIRASTSVRSVVPS